MRNCRKRKVGLSIIWKDYRKAYHMVPHSWIKKSMEMCGVADNISHLFPKRIESWHRGVVVITAAQLHSTKPELRLSVGSNTARGLSEICDGEDLWQWSRLEIRLNAFRRSTMPQKQFNNLNVKE